MPLRADFADEAQLAQPLQPQIVSDGVQLGTRRAQIERGGAVLRQVRDAQRCRLGHCDPFLC
ncbi:hypothetical protein SL1157_2598 [Ruegeria lacuscaerulensis ITI-1157]|nr:hypothetical protein SL1157_2598 [Ruegeria lacuscaerulensis ITI-1157]